MHQGAIFGNSDGPNLSEDGQILQSQGGGAVNIHYFLWKLLCHL